ncbi:MAG: D-glycero-beta-D-manno-heptose 1-phosphate adenylyltransferase [Candidatus Omnitrophica bacterium CG08_land_8_20_14_0_20_41_16]|uniref:D-glycero-beta-D-manno-heptose 1-phosphate adenylyltransferase n=1 Tax=Candidatus Sherwoodlollariibacterium unditelluris TaxID=1974757 RepID=A0A2G9YMW3_9BACT|nr:MAG: D-glycero-beta-D-manno-heptose 1-phosphate adenylyltransferase [Candidatus Omnitrophica bacterium CG23_combo_of_CG06-09_8_20_14_all_41_10]PIS33621.1 MAG: D-glycero-beta-D-manno-heptose 1-phosphate adenylyltransferase [Candidatus Omnitrophica bacterium CG08_land_8_20_14_0_20_41_16]
MRTHRRSQRLLKEKIKSLTLLKKLLFRLKRQGKKVVFTNGCFDILHCGHAKYLEAAKRKGDILVVAINSDASVKRIKAKTRPIVGERNRLSLVAALESVDFVIMFKEDTPLKVIKEIRPDILVKGADWTKDEIVGGNFVNSYGGKVKTIKLTKGLSTTNLIKKIVKTN